MYRNNIFGFQSSFLNLEGLEFASGHFIFTFLAVNAGVISDDELVR